MAESEKFKDFFNFFQTFKQSMKYASTICSVAHVEYEGCPNRKEHEAKLKELIKTFISKGIALLTDESFTLPEKKIDDLYYFSLFIYLVFFNQCSMFLVCQVFAFLEIFMKEDFLYFREFLQLDDYMYQALDLRVERLRQFLLYKLIFTNMGNVDGLDISKILTKLNELIKLEIMSIVKKYDNHYSES